MNDQPRTLADFIETCDDLMVRSGDLPDRAGDFADGVTSRLLGMKVWALGHDHVTPAMWTAVENIESGIERWEDRA